MHVVCYAVIRRRPNLIFPPDIRHPAGPRQFVQEHDLACRKSRCAGDLNGIRSR